MRGCRIRRSTGKRDAGGSGFFRRGTSVCVRRGKEDGSVPAKPRRDGGGSAARTDEDCIIHHRRHASSNPRSRTSRPTRPPRRRERSSRAQGGRILSEACCGALAMGQRPTRRGAQMRLRAFPSRETGRGGPPSSNLDEVRDLRARSRSTRDRARFEAAKRHVGRPGSSSRVLPRAGVGRRGRSSGTRRVWLFRKFVPPRRGGEGRVGKPGEVELRRPADAAIERRPAGRRRARRVTPKMRTAAALATGRFAVRVPDEEESRVRLARASRNASRLITTVEVVGGGPSRRPGDFLHRGPRSTVGRAGESSASHADTAIPRVGGARSARRRWIPRQPPRGPGGSVPPGRERGRWGPGPRGRRGGGREERAS